MAYFLLRDYNILPKKELLSSQEWASLGFGVELLQEWASLVSSSTMAYCFGLKAMAAEVDAWYL